MNYSTAVFLINKKVRAVMVSYERSPTDPTKCSGNLTMFKTLDPAIKVGDFAIVPTDTRWNMTVCRVEQVDCEVDLESSVHVGWLINSVDQTAYVAVRDQEQTAIAAIKSAEKRRKQEELAAALMKDNPELGGLSSVGSGLAIADDSAQQ